MPLYEYRCLDCLKRSTILVLNISNLTTPSCSYCKSGRMERLMSRFASPKSEEARLESLTDPNALSGLDENDPESMARFIKKMGDEAGEDFEDEISETMDSRAAIPSEMDESDTV